MAEQQAGRPGPFLLQTLIESLDSLRLLGRRSLLALLGIAVGCAAVIALLNIGHNAANESIRTFKGLGTNTLVAIFPHRPGDDRPGPTQLDVQALRTTLPMIEHIAPLILHSTHIQHRGQTLNNHRLKSVG
ncbi:ABC transporter permease [Stutzerimonas nitrititolerans]|uniref:ABC transporter permease n=1 Tax=Stutzerimonas nitrititolerans TaxID=2482751 RepID=UPI0028AC9301|nr:ABC transporter permease [Stutzerimonas nitrititolerans]